MVFTYLSNFTDSGDLFYLSMMRISHTLVSLPTCSEVGDAVPSVREKETRQHIRDKHTMVVVQTLLWLV